jgi:AsmA protein
MLRKVETAFLNSGASVAQQTDFSELSGTFKISKGIVSNSDLFMASPLLRVTGKGTADMPKRTVDYRVNPKAVTDARGQGGDTAITGIAVPVLITGPWHDVQFAPDLAGILTNLGSVPLEGAAKVAEGAVGAINGVAEGGAKGIGGLLNDVTKNIGGSEPAKDTAPKP